MGSGTQLTRSGHNGDLAVGVASTPRRLGILTVEDTRRGTVPATPWVMERNQRKQRLCSLADMNEVLRGVHLVASPATTVRDLLRVMGFQLGRGCSCSRWPAGGIDRRAT